MKKNILFLLNKDYFKQTRYYRTFEENIIQTFNRKPTKLECDIVFDTLNTLIRLKKEWATYRVNKQEHFDRNKKVLENYLNTYEKYYNKYFIDEFSKNLFEVFEKWLDEMNEIEIRKLDINCRNIKQEVDIYMTQLIQIKFDYIFNGYCYYRRNPSNKSLRGYMSVLEYPEGLNSFIQEYNNQYRFNKLTDDEDIKYIKKLYSYMGKVSVYLSTKDYISAHNIIYEILMCDKPNNLKAPFEYILKVFKGIDALILNEGYENAYKEFDYFRKSNDKWFARLS